MKYAEIADGAKNLKVYVQIAAANIVPTLSMKKVFAMNGGRMGKINSKDKGKRGELELVQKLKEHGFENARRSQQYAGINNDADVVGLPEIHIEVKRVEKLNVDNAIEQCHRDKKANELGVVAHRKNNKEWLVTMTLDDWMEIYKNYLSTIS